MTSSENIFILRVYFTYLLTYLLRSGAERVRKLNERDIKNTVEQERSGSRRSRERSGERGLLKTM